MSGTVLGIGDRAENINEQRSLSRWNLDFDARKQMAKNKINKRIGQCVRAKKTQSREGGQVLVVEPGVDFRTKKVVGAGLFEKKVNFGWKLVEVRERASEKRVLGGRGSVCKAHQGTGRRPVQLG